MTCPTTHCRNCPRQNACSRWFVVAAMALTTLAGLVAILLR